jgi:hypothetical protein
MVELRPQHHGARRGGSSQQLSAGCMSRPAALLVTGDSEDQREGGDCSSPKKPAASEFGVAGVEAARHRWRSSIEAARPAELRLSAEMRHCAKGRMVAWRRGTLRQRRRTVASAADDNWWWLVRGGIEEQRQRCACVGAGSSAALGQWVWELRTTPAWTGL